MMHEIRGLRDAGPRRVSVPSSPGLCGFLGASTTRKYQESAL